MANTLHVLRNLRQNVETVSLNTRVRLAAELIHDYRRAGNSAPLDKIYEYLGVTDEEVGEVYESLYGRSLHLNRVPPLQQDESGVFFPASETGVTDAQLYYLRSKGVVDLRILDGALFAHRDSWDAYKTRTNGYVSLAEAAEMLGISRPYVRKFLRSGILSSRVPGTHEYGNRYLIPLSELETLKPKLELINLSEASRKYNVTREDTRQLLKTHTLSAHKDKRKRKRTKTHWRRIRTAHEVLVRAIDFELYFNKLN